MPATIQVRLKQKAKIGKKIGKAEVGHADSQFNALDLRLTKDRQNNGPEGNIHSPQNSHSAQSSWRAAPFGPVPNGPDCSGKVKPEPSPSSDGDPLLAMVGLSSEQVL